MPLATLSSAVGSRLTTMHARSKKKALTCLAIGLPLSAGGWALMLIFLHTTVAVVGAVLALVGLVFYLWGCTELAKAKGYSTAIMLTFFLGGLFPLVVLLALPDKHRYRPWRARPTGRKPDSNHEEHEHLAAR